MTTSIARMAVLTALSAMVFPSFAQIDWTWRNPQTTGATLYGSASNGSVVVVAGDNGGIATSTDDTSWSVRKSGTSEHLRGVAWGNGSFYVAGQRGTLLTSPDGIAWTTRTSPTNQNLNAVVWAGSGAIAVGDSGTIINIHPDGVSAGVGGNSTKQCLRSAAWNGKVVAAAGDSGVVLVSSTETGWNAIDYGGLRLLTSITWTDSLFVTTGTVHATGGESTGYLYATCYYSRNGNSWTQSRDQFGGPIEFVAWTGSRIALLTYGKILMQQTDGEWKQVYSSPGEPLNTLHTLIAAGDRLVAAGYAGKVIVSSKNDSVWTQVGTTTSNWLRAVTWTGKQLVAVGDSGAILTSADGTRWTPRNTGVKNNLRDVNWNGSQFLAVGSRCMLRSSDGISWDSIPMGDKTADLYTVVWNGARYVAAGFPNTVLTSKDGKDWSLSLTSTEGASSANNGLIDIAWNGRFFAGVDYFGNIATSTNGSEWTNTSSQVRAALMNRPGIIAADERFMVFGNNSIVTGSADGTTWTVVSQPIGSSANFYSVVWSGREYVAVGSRLIVSSSDGSVWKPRFYPVTDGLNSIIFTGKQYVAVGRYGSILTSPLDTSGATAIRALPSLKEHFVPELTQLPRSLVINIPSNAGRSGIEVAVFSLIGRKVVGGVFAGTERRIQLSLADLAMGTYLWRMASDGTGIAAGRFAIFSR